MQKLAKVLHTDIEIMKHLHPQILEKRQQRQGSTDKEVDQELSWIGPIQESLSMNPKVQVRTFSLIESSF